MPNQFAIQLIEQHGSETTDSLFSEQHVGVFLVDWREADEDIINMAAETLGTQELSSKWQDEKLYVCYKNQMTLVPLMFEPGEQDKTLLALNTALSPDYEVRHIRASEGGDTIAFMALDTGTWKNLESTFGKKVEDAFMSLAGGSSLFS
ncbi:MAG: hypothetical protein WAV07_19505 [Candidatus Contendobacter sp.]